VVISELGLSAMYRILKKAGGNRISEDSAEELRRSLEEIVSKVANDAVLLSKHAGRKTILREDISLAVKHFLDDRTIQ